MNEASGEWTAGEAMDVGRYEDAAEMLREDDFLTADEPQRRALIEELGRRGLTLEPSFEGSRWFVVTKGKGQ